MKLASLRLQNFRSCEDLTVNFDDYTCLVGANGSGKSTVLTALNILFRNASGVSTGVAALTEEDFCNRDTSVPIVITAVFSQLALDEVAEFQNYVRQNQLAITAKAQWDPSRRAAEVRQFGARLVMKAFAPFFEQEKSGAKVAQLKELYSTLRLEYADLPAASAKVDMEAALRQYEESHPEACELIDSEDQFYGYTKGANRLNKYLQWVYIPAVKDAATEQDESKNSALGELLQRTLRPKVDLDTPLASLRRETSAKYSEIMDGHRAALQDASQALQSRLRTWSHTAAQVDLQWNTEPDRAINIQVPAARAKIGDGDFIGEVPRMGHGLQRAFIVAVLQELAESGNASSGPRLLLGFEEPELYQHPPQARHLSSVLEELSRQGAQIVLTTHSPYFVSGRSFENIRVVRRTPLNGGSVATQMTYVDLAGRIAKASGDKSSDAPTAMMANIEQILQPSLSELFFCGVPVLVEGAEDIAYLASYLHLSGDWPEFRRLGCHFVSVGGKDNMRRPIAMANGFGTPAFVVFDFDRSVQEQLAAHNAAVNTSILRLCGIDSAPTPDENYFSDRLVAWGENIGKAVQRDVGELHWRTAEQVARTRHGFISGVGGKNTLLIAAILEELHRENRPLLLLRRVGESILAYARKNCHIPAEPLVVGPAPAVVSSVQ